MTNHMSSAALSPQAYFQSAVTLPREHLLALQHVVSSALAFQSRSASVPKHPPPPYITNNTEPLYRPRMDMFETPSMSSSIDSRPTVTAVFELPGLRKEDVHIEIVEGNMIITGDRNGLKAGNLESAVDDGRDGSPRDDQSKMEEDGDLYRNQNSYSVREIKRGKFRRVITLHPSVQISDIKASMADGILTITFPGKPKPMRCSVPVA